MKKADQGAEVGKEAVDPALRLEAERLLGTVPPLDVPEPPAALRLHLQTQEHELQVRQIELELQNEQLRQTNLELELTRNRYTDLFQQAPLGYFMLDQSGTILEVNTTGCTQLGLTHERLNGRRLPVFVQENFRTHFAVFLRRVFETMQPCRVELTLVGQDGKNFYAQVDAVATAASDGTPSYARAAVIDISPLKEAQEAISLLNAVLEERVQARIAQIQELNDELEALVQSVTHDLRLPLQQINTYASQLQAKAEASGLPPQQELQQVLSGVDHLNELVGALFAYFKAGRQRARFFPVSLERVMADVRKSMKSELQARQVNLTQDPLPTICGDSRTLHMLFSHLLGNALKFSPQDRTAQIRVISQENEREYLICVRDNGIGFNMRHKDRMFGIFQRLHQERQDAGLGLGLALVRRIVMRHGGRVWAEGREGEGASIWVAFPKGQGEHGQKVHQAFVQGGTAPHLKP
ncbi:sensor histidine kinase [Deinococcus aquatilis]|jgi:PAS domain S-box-containing protein|uniref:sensor histidine kinase n=1 Tax=Deinococcus aquatilis TaxID=519440 RepID=UPI00037D73C9|nr:ATP-binding protein [Deinococcus aquatilis]